MGLFEPKWKSTNAKKVDKALAEVRAITDQQKLKQVVLEAPFYMVQKEALKHLDDPALLKELVLDLGHQPFGVRDLAIEALRKLDNQNLLNEITLSESTYAADAAELITDPKILIEIILSDADIKPIRQAMQRIGDPNVLKNVFRESSRLDVRKEIWGKLPLEDARQIAWELNVAAEDMCLKMGSHCNAPGPVLSYVDENFDEGFTSHELIRCELCGGRMRHRSKPTAKMYSWGSWEEVNPL